MSKELSEGLFLLGGMFSVAAVFEAGIATLIYVDKNHKYKARMERWKADPQMRFDFAKDQGKPEKITYVDIWKSFLQIKELPY